MSAAGPPPRGRLLVHGEVPPAARPRALGHRALHRPAQRASNKVTGAAMYSSDMTLPGVLHAKILRCPHARIRRIDTSRAEALPGVRAVLPRAHARRHTEWYMIAQPVFPERCLREQGGGGGGGGHRGHRGPRARLIDVEYETVPPCDRARGGVDPEAARGPVLDAARPREGNVQRRVYERARGDLEGGLAEADVVGTKPLHPTHPELDLHPAQLLHRELGRRPATVYDASQGATSRASSETLGQEHHVRVIMQYMGGGFGSKAARSGWSTTGTPRPARRPPGAVDCTGPKLRRTRGATRASTCASAPSATAR